jgi:hypothetical protein
LASSPALLQQEISFLIITQLLFFILKMGCRDYCAGLLLPFPHLQNTDRGIGFKLDIPIANSFWWSSLLKIGWMMSTDL